MTKNKALVLTLLIVTLFLTTIVTLRPVKAQSSEYSTIYAHKIVCINESDLPNWGDGGENTPEDIVENTAQEFVDASEGNCWLEPNWSFQWGFDSNTDEGIEGVHKLLGAKLGEADGTPSTCTFQCGSNTQTGTDYEDWKNFDTQTSNNGGPARVRIYDTQDAPGIWVREILKENYITYTYPPQGSIEDDATAELYCHNDIRNFDNYDLVWNPRLGRTYYCIGFNVPIGNQPDLVITKDDGRTTISQGDETTYTIIVSNQGDRIATGIIVKDTIPTGTEFVSASDNGEYLTGIVTWEIAQLAPQQQTEFTVTVKLNDQTELDDITNLVEVTDDGKNGADKDKSNNTATDTDRIENIVEPTLKISKTNNKTGQILKTNNEVTYFIKLEASGDIENVSLIDLPPEGFEYINGSWTANSNINGNIKNSVVTEPTYASPGKWGLGNMAEEETIIVSYKAHISSEIDPGTYKDVAWAKGTFNQGTLLAVSSTDANTNFVGTQVEVDVENDSPKAEVNVDVEIEEVLASTSIRLPDTGASSIWGIAIITLFLIGLVFVAVGMLENIKKTMMSAIVLAAVLNMLVTGGQAYAAENTTSLKIETPDEKTNGSFMLGFVALDLENKYLTAKCFVMRPDEASFTQFGNTIDLGAGGNSANCEVTDDMLTAEGDYAFKVKVYTEETEQESETVHVDFDKDGPDKPSWIKKREKAECKYEVTLKTADDNGVTDYVEVYRSNDNEFDANENTRIKTVNIGSNEEYTFIDELDNEDCDDTPYYAGRAFDEAGNASSVRPENGVTITRTITNEQADGARAIPVGGINLGTTTTGVTETSTERNINDFGLEIDGNNDFGDVLGEETFDSESLINKSEKSPNKVLWVILAIVIAGGIYYFIKKKR